MPKTPLKIDLQDTQKEGNKAFLNLLDPILWKRLIDQARESDRPLHELLDELLEHR